MRLQEREEWELLSAMPSGKMFLTGWCFKDLNEMREVTEYPHQKEAPRLELSEDDQAECDR